MKFAIVMLSLVISANVFAFSVTDVLVLTTASPLLSSATTSGAAKKAQADAVINDAQEMLQSGEISIFLSQKLQETQKLNKGISEAEALDILIESAQTILKLHY